MRRAPTGCWHRRSRRAFPRPRRTGRGRPPPAPGTASTRATRAAEMPTTASASAVHPVGTSDTPSTEAPPHGGERAPVGQVDHQRHPWPVAVDRAQAGGEPGDAAGRVGAASSGSTTTIRSRSGAWRPDSSDSTPTSAALSTSSAAASAARSLRCCPARVPDSPSRPAGRAPGRRRSRSRAAARPGDRPRGASRGSTRWRGRLGTWPPSTSPDSSPSSRTMPSTMASTSTTNDTSWRPTRCARRGRSTCIPRRAAARSTCTWRSRSTPGAAVVRGRRHRAARGRGPARHLPLPPGVQLGAAAAAQGSRPADPGHRAGRHRRHGPAPRGVGHRLVPVGHRRPRAQPGHRVAHRGVAGQGVHGPGADVRRARHVPGGQPLPAGERRGWLGETSPDGSQGRSRRSPDPGQPASSPNRRIAGWPRSRAGRRRR